MFPEFYNKKYNEYYITANNQWQCRDIVVKVSGSIPRFVPGGGYASLFGDQWKQYKRTQLDSYTGSPISANRLNRCLGDLAENLSGKLVLEAGCGAGRFTEILLKKGAKLVSSDLSTAVEVNAENFPVSDDHSIIQADINDMPYRNESFDVVICMGVIQHTPSPEITIKNLFALVKKGGSLVIDHYTFTRSDFLRFAAPVYRWFLRKKSSAITIPYTQKLVKHYLPLHKKYAHNKFMSMLLNRISPVISYYSVFPDLNNRLQEEWALLDTHDSLTDWHKNFRTKTQMTKILTDLDATAIWCEYGGNGVEARCRKL